MVEEGVNGLFEGLTDPAVPVEALFAELMERNMSTRARVEIIEQTVGRVTAENNPIANQRAINLVSAAIADLPPGAARFRLESLLAKLQGRVGNVATNDEENSPQLFQDNNQQNASQEDTQKDVWNNAAKMYTELSRKDSGVAA